MKDFDDFDDAIYALTQGCHRHVGAKPCRLSAEARHATAAGSSFPKIAAKKASGRMISDRLRGECAEGGERCGQNPAIGFCESVVFCVGCCGIGERSLGECCFKL